jgi:exosortase
VHPLSLTANQLRGFCGASLLALAAIWAFWPTLGWLVRTWMTQPDYSHGFLVPLVGIWLLWVRRGSCPVEDARWNWTALVLILASVGLRAAGAAFYVEAVDGWALVVWIAGVVALTCGWKMTRWAAPAIVFLLFMVPLPFRLEHSLSQPLQQIATRGSVFVLETLGQPAFAEGNSILIHEHVLEVERACAGLRIFVGIIAVAFAAAVVSRRSRVERSILLLSAIPVALAANVARIVITALFFSYGPATFARSFAHDGAGWLMVPLALILIGLVKWYLSRLIVDRQSIDVTDLVDRGRPAKLVLR